MNRLSDIYDGYMDYDDYDANMESTGNPEGTIGGRGMGISRAEANASSKQAYG